MASGRNISDPNAEKISFIVSDSARSQVFCRIFLENGGAQTGSHRKLGVQKPGLPAHCKPTIENSALRCSNTRLK